MVRYARFNGIRPRAQGVTCPWFQEGRCAVHPVRPRVCQLFGHSEKLLCKHGYNVNLPERKVRRELNRKRPETNLHEVLGPGEGLRAMGKALGYER